MWKQKLLALGCAVCLALSLAGCGGGTAVYVQSVQALSSLGGIAPGDRFGGLVVSEFVAEIHRDADKSVKELLVKEGDDVKEGAVLFSYDTEELQLNLDKQRLEQEQLTASIENYKEKLKTLERERNSVTGTAKLQYTVEIQSTEVDLKEAELKLKAKENEVKKAEELLENSDVVSPITGRVQAINESGTDNRGNETAYITIQKAGAYRIKGVLGELQRGGIIEGDRMKILSRTDKAVSWSGTVTLVDYENPSQGNQYDMYYGNSSDEMTASSKYPFYVELDSTDGLILGQHVYLEMETEEGELAGPGISSAFLNYDENGEPFVWAERRGKLEKRRVTLGEYNAMADIQEIASGLSMEDYIAFPDPELCKEGVSTTRDKPAEEVKSEEDGVVEP